MTYKMGTIVSTLQGLWALNEIRYIKDPAPSLAQSTAQNINTSIITTIMIINTINNFYLE